VKTPEDAREGIVCPSCLAKTPVRIGYCTHCGIPVHLAGSLDPIQSHVLCQSFVISRAFGGKANRFVKWGILLLFGLPLVQLYSLGDIRVGDGPAAVGEVTFITGSMYLMIFLILSVAVNIAVIYKTLHVKESPRPASGDREESPPSPETPGTEGGG
jgi:hypothetical protein